MRDACTGKTVPYLTVDMLALNLRAILLVGAGLTSMIESTAEYGEFQDNPTANATFSRVYDINEVDEFLWDVISIYSWPKICFFFAFEIPQKGIFLLFSS